MSTAEFAKTLTAEAQPLPTSPSDGEPFDEAAIESMLVLDRAVIERVRDERISSGAQRYDEVREGVYIVSPLANNQHQSLAFLMASAFQQGLGDDSGCVVLPGANVSDRRVGWSKNYCIPDVLVLKPGCKAIDRGTFFEGGPDFAVEIASKNDQTRDKLPFYGKVHTGELLIIDRDPWRLELYRLKGDEMASVGEAKPGGEGELTSEELPFAFKLLPAEGDGRPMIAVRHTGGAGEWCV